MVVGINWQDRLLHGGTRFLPGRKYHGLFQPPLLRTWQYSSDRTVNALVDFAKGKLETNETFKRTGKTTGAALCCAVT